jgi:hypothetical protein
MELGFQYKAIDSKLVLHGHRSVRKRKKLSIMKKGICQKENKRKRNQASCENKRKKSWCALQFSEMLSTTLK